MKKHPETQYLKLMAKIIKKGRTKQTRGIHPVKSIFGEQLKFDFRQGFPMLTTKKLPWKMMTRELLWFISGDTNIKYLNDNNIHIWDGFALPDGDLGPIYGYQWRFWPDGKGGHIDQLQNVIDEIKNSPDSKAMIVSAWNPGQLEDMRLPPCHTFFQFNVTKGKLRLQLYQRSSDVFLGLPFNIFEYALLLKMVAHLTGLEARELVVSIGDAHLYTNHIDSAKEQLSRQPRKFPTLEIDGTVPTMDDFKIENITIEGYDPHPHIKADMVIV